jgi:hypothetical protein
VEVLVAASKFGDMSNRKDLVNIAAELHKDLEQTDTQAMIVHRDSVLLRLCRKSEGRATVHQPCSYMCSGPNSKSLASHIKAKDSLRTQSLPLKIVSQR